GSSAIYQYDGATVGGQGPNVTFRFRNTDSLIDNSADNNTFHVNGYALPYYFLSYASPFNSGNRLGYQRDEIYRFGVIFTSTKGQVSPAHYIADIRMPGHSLVVDGASDNRFCVYVAGNSYSSRLYLEFTLENIPNDVAGWQIVRVERKAEDRTVLFQGRMSFFDHIGSAGGGGYVVPGTEFTTRINYTSHIPATRPERTHLFISSPEVAFYKDYKSAAGDYLQVIGSFRTDLVSSYGANDWHKVFKFVDFEPVGYASSRKSAVEEGVTCETEAVVDSEIIEHTFGSITYLKNVVRLASTIPLLQQIGNLGTGALVKIEEGFSMSGLYDDCYPVVNYRRPVVQYGGKSYEARLTNKYIPAGEYVPKTASSMTKACYGGDTYIQFFDFLHVYYNDYYSDLDGYDSLAYVEMFPVESTINLDLRHDDCWHRIKNSNDSKILYQRGRQ
ncbi:MAG: hypothetical protein HC875_29585, partial [Anaerolineales bacterium]|nr:hypothetical protein [Anaerolineales bacterium]